MVGTYRWKAVTIEDAAKLLGLSVSGVRKFHQDQSAAGDSHWPPSVLSDGLHKRLNVMRRSAASGPAMTAYLVTIERQRQTKTARNGEGTLTMGEHLAKWPAWAEKAMQGLAFWIGHRHALYRQYPLSEGALVGEVCNLIYANREPGEDLLCEQQYSFLLPDGMWPTILGPKARADLVVTTQATARATTIRPEHIHAVVEVKRANAPTAQINDDLKRLAAFKTALPQARAFLFLIAEAQRPRRFVAPEGKAILGKTAIPGTRTHYRVRRACKAAAAFSGKETAHYACIIEVFNDPTE
jgi:hypothetical protein